MSDRLLLLLALAGCVTPSPDAPKGGDAEDSEPLLVDSEAPVDSEPAPVEDSEPADSPAEESDEPVSEELCDNLPALPRTGTMLRYTPGCEDFTFDAAGHHVCIGASGLFYYTEKAPNSTTQQPPRMAGMVRGTRFLPNGDVLVADADNGAVWRVVPGGGRVLAAAVAQPNGIVVAQDGTAYIATTTGWVHRIDGATGEHVQLVEVGVSCDGIALSPDDSILYVNTEFGAVKKIALLPNGTVGPVQQHANIQIGLSLLDGMTTDSCGNLYVTVMSGKIWRVAPDGTTELAIDVPGGLLSITPAVNFGSGWGGWERNSLYVALFTGGLYEVDMGVPGRRDPHW
jgi:sugar lactone lactonase YvrE